MLKAAAGPQKARRSPELRETGRSHDLEAVSHMTMDSPSHQPLLPSSQAPPWAQELPGTAAVTHTGLQGLGGYQTAQNLSAGISTVSSNFAAASPATFSSRFSWADAGTQPKSVCLALACPAYLFTCICLLITIYVSMWQIFFPDYAWFRCHRIN